MIHVGEGMSQPMFCCSLFSELQSMFLGDKGRGGGLLSALWHDLNWYTCLSQRVFNWVQFIHCCAFLPVACLPAFLLCGCRVSSCQPGGATADVIIVRCLFLQSEGMFLPREGLHTNSNFWRNHARLHTHTRTLRPLGFFSLAAATSLRAALEQEGNYLSTPITSMPAILLTSAPGESPPLQTVEDILDQFRERNHGAGKIQHTLVAAKLRLYTC